MRSAPLPDTFSFFGARSAPRSGRLFPFKGSKKGEKEAFPPKSDYGTLQRCPTPSPPSPPYMFSCLQTGQVYLQEDSILFKNHNINNSILFFVTMKRDLGFLALLNLCKEKLTFLWVFVLIFGSFFLVSTTYTNYSSISMVHKELLPTPHFKVVVLVVASHNKPIYFVYRRLMLAYADVEPSVKFYFVYGKNAAPPLEELTDHDLLVDFRDVQREDTTKKEFPLGYVVGNTVYPAGLINKTIQAMKEVDKRCTFDYLVRTNLSTFWYLKALLKKLQALPKTMCFSGPLLNWFTGPAAAGFAITISNDLVGAILNFPEDKILLDRDFGIPEDILLGNEITSAYKASLLNSDIGEPKGLGPKTWYINANAVEKNSALEDIINGLTNRADHIRMAYGNNDPRRSIIYYRILLQVFYNKCFPKVSEEGVPDSGPCEFELEAEEALAARVALNESERLYDISIADFLRGGN